MGLPVALSQGVVGSVLPTWEAPQAWAVQSLQCGFITWHSWFIGHPAALSGVLRD